MESSRFDTISRLFATRRLSRRSALATGGAGLAAAALGSAASAQDATPAATPVAETDHPSFLFVQSFGAGSIAAAANGQFTLTADHLTGQTIFFSDRPERIVGTVYVLVGPLAWLTYGVLMYAGRRKMLLLHRPPPPLNTDKPPRVTILIPAKDEGERIRACIESALAQDYPNFSVIAMKSGRHTTGPYAGTLQPNPVSVRTTQRTPGRSGPEVRQRLRLLRRPQPTGC